MFVTRYIVHCEDDGTFLAIRNGQHSFVVSFEEALRFECLDHAIQNAFEIDETMNRVSVIPLYEPIRY